MIKFKSIDDFKSNKNLKIGEEILIEEIDIRVIITGSAPVVKCRNCYFRDTFNCGLMPCCGYEREDSTSIFYMKA